MSRSIFGWSLPPGCTHRDIEEAAGSYERCEVCGRNIDDCVCPECPGCNNVGDPFCYDHGHWGTCLQRNEAQILGHRLFIEAVEAEEDHYAQLYEEEMRREQ